jgi:hypothetical protein
MGVELKRELSDDDKVDVVGQEKSKAKGKKGKKNFVPAKKKIKSLYESLNEEETWSVEVPPSPPPPLPACPRTPNCTPPALVLFSAAYPPSGLANTVAFGGRNIALSVSSTDARRAH